MALTKLIAMKTLRDVTLLNAYDAAADFKKSSLADPAHGDRIGKDKPVALTATERQREWDEEVAKKTQSLTLLEGGRLKARRPRTEDPLT